jgi:K+-transporting ATPase ATPase A chain
VTGNGWLQILLCIALLLATVKPLGWYLARVFQGQPTPISPLVRPIERAIYRVAGVDGDREQSWFAYALAFLAFHLIGMLLFYALLRLQGLLPLNPAGQMGMTPDLALNTAISFASWESYAGETALSYLSQMAGVGVQSFLSAAAGIAVAVALVRGFARHGVATIGNFWVDMTRAVLFVLLPICVVAGLFFAWDGVPQTLHRPVVVATLEGAPQTISLGPVASQEAIKLLSADGRRCVQRAVRPSVRDADGRQQPVGDVADRVAGSGADQRLWADGR